MEVSEADVAAEAAVVVSEEAVVAVDFVEAEAAGVVEDVAVATPDIRVAYSKPKANVLRLTIEF